MSEPPVCPYCGQPAKLVTGDHVYPTRADLFEKNFYRCDDCDAHVGTHAKSGLPLGTLANATLRAARLGAHEAFDPIWKKAANGEYHGRVKRKQHVAQIGHYIKKHRTRAYAMLAKAMDISPENCHIGVFTEAQCLQVIHLCTSGEIYLFRGDVAPP